MTDAELEAAIAIFGLAQRRLPGNKPILRIIPAEMSDPESTITP
jgi:hypothetical protein